MFYHATKLGKEKNDMAEINEINVEFMSKNETDECKARLLAYAKRVKKAVEEKEDN